MMLYEEILQDFSKDKVKYVLVGGLALNLLGGERATHDMDILVDMTDDNLRKVVGILKSRGYKVKQPVDPLAIANKKIRGDWIRNKNMKAFNFYKEDELKEVDIIIDSPIRYSSAAKDAVLIKIGSLNVFVISVKKLIAMKRGTGRAVDKFDINVLNKIGKIRTKS